jgi:glycine/D-amino acid oxidase-like deaminating enzyme/nitrite reductase/ring-hydroxylating ferredoxin subunit
MSSPLNLFVFRLSCWNENLVSEGMNPDQHQPGGIISAGSNISCWFEPGMGTDHFPRLESDLETEVVIVGGGIGGLSVAYHLSKAGKKVVLVEDGFIGSGETGRTTAHLVTALDLRYYKMKKHFSETQLRLIAESHMEAIRTVEQIIREEKIDCDFRQVDGYLFRAPGDDEDTLIKELNAGKELGLPLEWMDHVPGLPSGNNCLRFPGQVEIHPLKYILGLCRAIEKRGGKIFIETHAKDIGHKGIVTEKGHRIKAAHVVVATNAPVNDKYAMMLKQWAYRSYVMAAKIKKGILPHAFWWDTGAKDSHAYHYVRLQDYSVTHDLLISGGEDHLAGLAKAEHLKEEERYAVLEKWTRERFPIEEITHRWSGEILMPLDTIAFIGRNQWDHGNVFIVTGDAGLGMTYCSIAGVIIKDLILGKENRYEKIYSPARFSWTASKPFFRMLKGDLLEIFKKWFGTVSGPELSAISCGTAAIVKIKNKRCGAYRDDENRLHIVSADCSHLKCLVQWNGDEKSWDCPCHGSRFTYTGRVINGPANKDLEYKRGEELD